MGLCSPTLGGEEIIWHIYDQNSTIPHVPVNQSLSPDPFLGGSGPWDPFLGGSGPRIPSWVGPGPWIPSWVGPAPGSLPGWVRALGSVTLSNPHLTLTVFPLDSSSEPTLCLNLLNTDTFISPSTSSGESRPNQRLSATTDAVGAHYPACSWCAYGSKFIKPLSWSGALVWRAGMQPRWR